MPKHICSAKRRHIHRIHPTKTHYEQIQGPLLRGPSAFQGGRNEEVI